MLSLILVGLTNKKLSCFMIFSTFSSPQSTGAVEYTDCISEKG